MRLSTHAAFVIWNKLGLKMEILRRDTSPDVIDIGENSLLISAGKDNPCALTPCGKDSNERVKATINKTPTLDCRLEYGVRILMIFLSRCQYLLLVM